MSAASQPCDPRWSDGQIPESAQRLVPVGPLLELVAEWRRIARRCRDDEDWVMAAVFEQHADLVSALLGKPVLAN